MIEIQGRGEMENLQKSISVERAHEIFWSYIDTDEFVRAVVALRGSLGDKIAAVRIEKALKGPADLNLENSNNSDGRNFMFELIMAGRFAAAGYTPAFDKGPDVQISFAGLELAVQCKRPFSVAGLEQNIGKAIHQLKDGKADLNLIAVSVSRLLNDGDPGGIPEVAHRELGHPYLQKRHQIIAQQSKRCWFGKLERAGILFYAFTPIRCPQRPNYFIDRCESIFSLDPKEPTPTLFMSFAQSLKS
jgi:hypothetical protein